MSFPLENARLCMDCDTVFDSALCPSCGSESYFPLSRWVRPALEEIRPKPPEPPHELLSPRVKKTARNASILLAGSGLAYGLWRAFMSKGRSGDKVEDMARRSSPGKPRSG
jgi:hypothetical protein